MLPFIANIFGVGKTAEKGLDIAEKGMDWVGSGIDKAFYTEEEKADANLKILNAKIEFVKMFAGENSEQSKARRELANMVFKSFFSLIFMGVAVWFFNKEYALFIFSIVAEISGLSLLVAGAYFGPHQLSKIFQWKKK